MNNNSTLYLLKLLFIEEFRLHKDIFNGYRFLAFPLVIASLVLSLSIAFTQTDALLYLDPIFVVAGIQALIFIFGIQTGSIAFINRDQFQDLLGDVTPILHGATILPRSQKSVMQLFILKDIVYYLFLLILPVSVGLLPLYAQISLPLVILSLIGLFSLGIGVSVLWISLYYRFGTLGFIGLTGGVIAFVVGLEVYGLSVLLLTPAAFMQSSSSPIFFTGVGWLITVCTVLVGSYLFTPRNSRSQITITKNYFTEPSYINSIVGLFIDDTNLAVKQHLDISRSSAGLGKVFFSYFLLFVVAVGILRFIEPITLEPSAPLYLATVLSMGVFTVYMWINEADSYREYRIYPIPLQKIFRAKFILFLYYTLIPTIALTILAGIYTNSSIGIVLLSVILAIGISVYTYGISTRFAGFQPREVLFDSIQFAKYSLATILPLIPILIISLFMTSEIKASLLFNGLLILYSILLGSVGYYLYANVGSMWESRLGLAK